MLTGATPVAEREVEQLEQPTYEEELRSSAHWLRRKAAGVPGIPVLGVLVSPEYAIWIARRLENHADDVEGNRG